MSNIIVLNASQNNDGNSIRMARSFLSGKVHQIVNLNDYHIGQIGQVTPTDQLENVNDLISLADQLVITTPVYWSDMPGYLKTFIDRSGNPSSNQFSNIECYLLIQGTEPSDAIKPISHVVDHWATRNHMKFMGSASYETEINALKKKL